MIAKPRDKARHAFLRRVMNPCFSPTSLKALEKTMNLYYEQFILEIRENAKLNGGSVEMNERFHNLSFDA